MPFVSDRRGFLRAAAVGSTGIAAAVRAGATGAGQKDGVLLAPGSISVADLPRHFDVESGVHNLENGYWGVMPRVVTDAYLRHTAFVNRTSSIWARNALAGGACLAAGGRDARAAIARQVNCAVEEIAVTRSGAEALNTLITQYRPLKPGDAVICCDLDYDDMIAAVDWLGTHRGAQVVKFAMPEPATTANILAAYEAALVGAPRAKLLLVTQVSNKTGLVTPVREIVAMARKRGVDTVVDAAHGVACIDFVIADLGADFIGWSVHKWTSAPLGTGAMYIRRSQLADIDVAGDEREPDESDITSRVPAGTVNFAAVLAIPTAVDFHFAIGTAAKERHLRGLRDRWVLAVRDLANVEICVPGDPARYCLITSFRLKGMVTDGDAQALQHRLFEKYRIHTVWRKGIAKGPVIRVTPGLYSTTDNIDALTAALQIEHRLFT